MKLLKISAFGGLSSFLICNLQFACLLTSMVICNLCYPQPVTQEWVRRYPDTNIFNAGANALALDDSGNVYVTGYAFGNPGPYRYCTLKYSASGKLQWVNQYYGDSTGGRFAFDIALDNSSNVYVTGYSSETGFDYCTIKYNSMGLQQWVQYYDSPLHGEDEGEKIAVDNAGNIYVSGYSTASGGANFGYATVKYSPEGNVIWVRTFGGGVTTHVKGLLVDDSCYVYVTGQNMQQAVTIKYDSSGTELWARIYYGVGIPSTGANSIALDENKNVYITGLSKGNQTYFDYFTIKYSYSGVQQWIRRFNADSTVSTSANAGTSIVLDNAGDVYITGYAGFINGQNPTNFCTLKYSNSGDLMWMKRDTAVVAGGPINMVIDDKNNIYVSGATSILPLYASYTIIKYDSSGTQKWRQIYNFANGDSYPYSLQVDKQYNVYLTGHSGASKCTIKYSQLTAIEPISTSIPKAFRLYQNYPNPFNANTKFKIKISELTDVRVVIYDIIGKLINTIINRKISPGTYELDFHGTSYSTGIYFYSLFVGGTLIDTQKMILLK